MHKKIIPDWRSIQRQNFTDWQKLADFLELSSQQRDLITKKPKFPLNLPLRLAKKITKKTLHDPILIQFLPTLEEEKDHPLYLLDPVGDSYSSKTSKLLHKYEGRVLLITTSACAMHCRFCFRQNFPYNTSQGFDHEINLIANDPSIHEVILSGGDPLSLSNQTLKQLFDQLTPMNHIKRIRFHTRFPIGIPERLDEEFIYLLSQLPQQVWFIIHVNHPRELDSDILEKLSELRKSGVILLNQAVLLKNVNDSFEILKELCETLVDNGILPYYLNQLDRVKGSAHFEVPETQGKELIQQLTASLPGYAVPKYVREIAGQNSKTLFC